MDEFVTVNDGLRLLGSREQLPFGTDALLLTAFLHPSPKGVAVDLGSGSGCIALLAAKRGLYSKIYAVDVQAHLASPNGIIAKNAEENGLGEQVIPLCRDLRELTEADFGGRVDVVSANPPYLPPKAGKENERESVYISRHEVHGGIDDFTAAAGRLLRHGGRFFCVYRPDRVVDLLTAMRRHDIEPKRLLFVCRDASHAPLAVLAEGKKGARPSAFVTRPLLLYENGTETAEYRHILERGCFDESYRAPR